MELAKRLQDAQWRTADGPFPPPGPHLRDRRPRNQYHHLKTHVLCRVLTQTCNARHVAALDVIDKCTPALAIRPISQIRALVYYDGVQVFKGRDSNGGCYVGVLVDDSGAADRYLVTGVAAERLRQFCAGAIDLRTLFLEAGPDEWLLADIADGFRVPLTPFRPEDPDACRALLPEEGFVLHRVTKISAT